MNPHTALPNGGSLPTVPYTSPTPAFEASGPSMREVTPSEILAPSFGQYVANGGQYLSSHNAHQQQPQHAIWHNPKCQGDHVVRRYERRGSATVAMLFSSASALQDNENASISGRVDDSSHEQPPPRKRQNISRTEYALAQALYPPSNHQEPHSSRECPQLSLSPHGKVSTLPSRQRPVMLASLPLAAPPSAPPTIPSHISPAFHPRFSPMEVDPSRQRAHTDDDIAMYQRSWDTASLRSVKSSTTFSPADSTMSYYSAASGDLFTTVAASSDGFGQGGGTKRGPGVS